MKIFIFDNDGVVTKSQENFSTKLIRERNLDPEKVNAFFRDVFVPKCMIGKADLKEELAKALPEWGIEDDVDSILKEWFESENNVDGNLISEIQKLRKKGIKCYMATNQEKYRTEYLLTEMKFAYLFDGVFSSANIGHKKPSREFYEVMFIKIGESGDFNPTEIYYFDDEEENVEAAREFGINAILYRSILDLKRAINESK